MALESEDLDLPANPGVYLFKQKDGRVLYVGKANNLKERVRSYFSRNPDRKMIPTLVEKSKISKKEFDHTFPGIQIGK